MLRLWRRSAAAASLLLLAAAAGQAQPRSRADCEAAHAASWGRAGKDVPWVPSYDAVVLAMLSMAQVTPADRLLDLGAGDGRIAITAAKPPFGARAVGIEYDPDLAKLAACLVQVEGVADRVRIVQGDIFREDFGDANVVTLYLRQAFGKLAGEITRGGVPQALASATVRGVELRFTFDAAGVVAAFSGTVHDGEITGVLRTGMAARTVAGRLRGALRAVPWAEMPGGCERYYER